MTERALIFCQGDQLSESDFILKNITSSALPPSTDQANFMPEEEKRVREMLRSCNYNQTETACALGITRDALIRKIKKYGITIARVGL